MAYSSATQKRLLEMLEGQFNQFHTELDCRAVISNDTTLEPLSLPTHGMGVEQLCMHFNDQVAPKLSASNGGRYWGFVTGGANPTATLADWFVTVFNQNVSKGGDSVASQLERQTIDWLRTLFYLPDSFTGLFTTGATAANLLGALTARQFIGAQQGVDVAQQGMAGLDVMICAASPHASMIKSLGMAGFGQQNWQCVDTLQGTEAMCIDSLATHLSRCDSRGKIVIASAATVTGTDYDDLIAISRLCEAHGAWLHVDAAFGIFERLMNGPEHKTNGIEFADSITLDCHKWLNVPYDCGVFLTRQPNHLVATCHVDAPYLASSAQNQDYMSMGIENSRRFRALPVWATLLSYGRQGITAHIQSNVDLAQALASWLENSQYYVLLKPCELNVVLFKPGNMHVLQEVGLCLDAINQSGKVFMTPGVWQGEHIIRAAFSNWETTTEDLLCVIELLDSLAK
ncbi:pyridoxal-dependent decarboxylase [Pseudoalteromonas sp. MMG012]|uniref:pyridoxal phosphate-dependent decarboxylase family protein n=1 Tax=Pseudoalteromonas sp. MMG012 TaxID=2822686 RepID=UPI001B3A414C|nr:pyridoxal-dependent decarboxylase [Pseudoalteromonas sp. MMG012]MBQ4852422.1 aspartate aminotransferase family protein [Pseudoalteromonas sp. MMG012]